jgi:hypothetical protein
MVMGRFDHRGGHDYDGWLSSRRVVYGSTQMIFPALVLPVVARGWLSVVLGGGQRRRRCRRKEEGR